MRPDDDLFLVHTYVDGEMDLQSTLAFEERLRTDPALRARVDEVKRVTSAIHEQADYHSAPESLRQMFARPAAQVDAPQARATAAPASSNAISAFVSRWLAWRPLVPALALALIATVATNLFVLESSRSERLDDELVASHVRATITDHTVDVVSSDHHTVKPYLSSKLDFSPPVREPSVHGTEFVGARVDYVDGRRVAVLVYRQGQHLVDHFVWPSKDGEQAVEQRMSRGFHIAQWNHAGMAHRVVSDVNGQELQAIIEDLRLE